MNAFILSFVTEPIPFNTDRVVDPAVSTIDDDVFDVVLAIVEITELKFCVVVDTNPFIEFCIPCPDEDTTFDVVAATPPKAVFVLNAVSLMTDATFDAASDTTFVVVVATSPKASFAFIAVCDIVVAALVAVSDKGLSLIHI